MKLVCIYKFINLKNIKMMLPLFNNNFKITLESIKNLQH